MREEEEGDAGRGGSLGACRIVEEEAVVPFELIDALEVERALSEVSGEVEDEGNGNGKEVVVEEFDKMGNS